MPLFDLRIRWTESSDPQITFFPVGFCNIGRHKKTDPFIRSKSKNLKLGNGSMRISLILMSQHGDTGWMYRSYRSVRYRVDVEPNLPKCLVPVSMLYRYRYQLRYRHPYRYRCTKITEVSGTGIDVVRNLPKGPVPVLMSYRTYRSVRYRYGCRTELTEVSGTGIDAVPNLPKCPVPV